ncbi:MAG: tyrosine-type recombinase/integrase, partial [Bacteriovoracaceae bacterium]
VQTESPTLAFDDEEVVKMIQAPDTSTVAGACHKMAMILLFSLGLRRSELVNIKVDDLYRERKHWVIKIRGKGGKERHMPLPPPVLAALKEYTDAMASFGRQFRPGDHLLASQKTKTKNVPISGSTVYRIIEKYAKELGINKKVSPHSCRATAISHLLDTQKTPIRDVAIFAGHSKITTTERYDKRREGLDNSAAYDIDYGGKAS